MSIQAAIERVGTAKALADLIGVSPQVVSNWKTRGVPPEQCKAIEAATGVTVKDLRPEDWRKYWPELG
jgi:DNA-binding transcriptional regulator YdaS (Cro superfamily)